MSGCKRHNSNRPGSEKDWNKYSEPFVRWLSGKFPVNRDWIKYRQRRHIEEVNYEIEE